MTKQQTTRKTINNNFKNIYCVGYCGLSYLLRAFEARYYNAGIYGWNWDAYPINNTTIIVTGYRNMPGECLPYELTQEFNKQAELIIKNSKFNWLEQQQHLRVLALELLETLEQL